MKRSFLAIIMAAGVGIGVGCVDADDDGPEEEAEATGVALTVDVQGDTDVAGFHFTIAECETGEVVDEATKDLEDLVLPGMIPQFDNAPFDERSRHLFSDYFTTLDPGCYDVTAQPVDAAGADSEDCDSETKTGVEVVAGKTTEVLLVSQCEGAKTGGLDVVVALNHPPKLKDIDFEKFNFACKKVQACATAVDPDGDPLRFEWKQVRGPKLASPIRVVSQQMKKKTVCHDKCKYDDYREHKKGGGGAVTECIEMKLGKPGDYFFKLTVRDLYWVKKKLVPIPDSAMTIKFPFYAGDHDKADCKPKKKYGR